MRNFRCLISTILQHGNKVPWSRETSNHPYLSPSLACVPCIKEMQYKNHHIWFSIKLRTRPNQYTCYWWINCYNTSSYLIDSWCNHIWSIHDAKYKHILRFVHSFIHPDCDYKLLAWSLRKKRNISEESKNWGMLRFQNAKSNMCGVPMMSYWNYLLLNGIKCIQNLESYP